MAPDPFHPVGSSFSFVFQAPPLENLLRWPWISARFLRSSGTNLKIGSHIIKIITAARLKRYNIVNDNIPSTISDLAVWRNSPYDLRGYKKAVVPRFSTYIFCKKILFVIDSCSFKQFHRKVQSDPKFREFRFISS